MVHHEHSDKVVGSATLAVEHKFIQLHGAANYRGRIEDADFVVVLVDPDSCYKLSMDFYKKAKPFYEKLNMDFVEDH